MVKAPHCRASTLIGSAASGSAVAESVGRTVNGSLLTGALAARTAASAEKRQGDVFHGVGKFHQSESGQRENETFVSSARRD
jgi:hypothetical protein